MESIRVNIPDDVAVKLAELAQREYRAPRHQAAVLLVDAIDKAARRRPRRQDVAR